MSDDDEDAIVVFTARSPERIIREGGSQAWVLNPAHAKRCNWLVCTQNRHNPDHEFSDASEPHGSAFLLGKIAAIVRAPEAGSDDRWMVTLSEFARIHYPHAWDHGRNPVRYSSLKQLGIDLEGVVFQPMPPRSEAPPPSDLHHPNTFSALTIAEAKKVLAATFGVRPEAVEITIRG